MKDHLLGRGLEILGAGALKAAGTLERWGELTRQETGKFLAQLMPPEERDAFSLHCYDTTTWESEARRGLRPWEEQWFDRALPRAPASLLVAACGTGREMLPLIDRGYRVAGFDGAPRPLEFAKVACPPETTLLLGTYSGFVESVLGQSSNALEPIAQDSYDAVILGWGSLTHVAGQANRRAVLRAAARLTDGPILLSVFSAPKEEQEGYEVHRAVRLGRALGKNLGRPAGPSYLTFSSWGGFAEYITKEEMAVHAAALGRDVEWDEGHAAWFPHMTMHRPSPNSRP